MCLFIYDEVIFDSINSDMYDGMTIAGAFAPGHVKGDCFPELIRVTKPGMDWFPIFMLYWFKHNLHQKKRGSGGKHVTVSLFHIHFYSITQYTLI